MGDPLVRMKRTTDGGFVNMTMGQAQVAMRTNRPGADRPMFVPSGPMPGFTSKDDGGTLKTSFDPEQAVLVANSQGASGYPNRLAFGSSDPGFKAASEYESQERLRQVGRNRSGTRVAFERGANVLSFGAYGAIVDDNPEQSQARAYQNQEHRVASLIGTVGGLAVSTLLPFGAAGQVLGKGAMAAGKAGGMVRGSQIAGRITEGTRATNLLTLGADAAQGARALVEGTFAKNVVGAVAGSAVIEAPLALAVAAADFVDYNKPFSAQALVADAGALWLTGVAIGGALGVPFAAVRAGGGAIRRGVARGGAKEGAGAAAGVADVVGSAASRAVDRAAFKGGGGGFKSALKSILGRKVIRHVTKASKSKFAREATGELIEDFRRPFLTYRKVADKFKSSSLRTSDDIQQAVRQLKPLASTSQIAGDLETVAVNATGIKNAQTTINVTGLNAPKYADEFGKLNLKAPKGVTWAPDVVDDAVMTLRGIDQDLARAAAGRPMSEAEKALGKELSKIGKSIKKNSAGGDVYSKLVAAKKKVFESNLPGGSPIHAKLNDSLERITLGNRDAMKQITSFEDYAGGLGSLRRNLDKIKNSPDGITDGMVNQKFRDSLDKMNRNAERIGVNAKTRKLIENDAGVHAQGTTQKNMDSLATMNRTRAGMLADDGANLGKQFKLPAGPREAVSVGDSMLDSQIDSAMTHMQQTGRALKFLTLSGAHSGAAAFGGVLAFRAMTETEKRDEFEFASEVVIGSASSPERLIAAVGQAVAPLAEQDMEAGTSMAITLATAMSYMNQQMPKSSDPLITQDDYSMSEIEEFLERSGAIESPASVLASAQDGSTDLAAVDALRTVYPQLYSEMILDVVEFLETDEGKGLSYNAMLGLDTFTGGALGVTQAFGAPISGAPSAQTPIQQQSLGKNQQQSSPEMARINAQTGNTASAKVASL